MASKVSANTNSISSQACIECSGSSECSECSEFSELEEELKGKLKLREKEKETETHRVRKLRKHSNSCKSITHFVLAFSNLKKELSKRGYKVSETQMRLIFKKLAEENSLCVSYSEQKEVFVKAVMKYVNVSEEFVKSVL